MKIKTSAWGLVIVAMMAAALLYAFAPQLRADAQQTNGQADGQGAKQDQKKSQQQKQQPQQPQQERRRPYAQVRRQARKRALQRSGQTEPLPQRSETGRHSGPRKRPAPGYFHLQARTRPAINDGDSSQCQRQRAVHIAVFEGLRRAFRSMRLYAPAKTPSP